MSISGICIEYNNSLRSMHISNFLSQLQFKSDLAKMSVWCVVSKVGVDSLYLLSKEWEHNSCCGFRALCDLSRRELQCLNGDVGNVRVQRDGATPHRNKFFPILETTAFMFKRWRGIWVQRDSASAHTMNVSPSFVYTDREQQSSHNLQRFTGTYVPVGGEQR